MKLWPRMKPILEIEKVEFRRSEASAFRIAIPKLAIYPGTIHALVGASGSGKTTVLQILLGKLKPSSGSLLRHSCLDTPRAIGYVSQDNSLLPWRNVAQNVQWGCAANCDKAAIAELIERCGLQGHSRKYPDELSGGLKRRVMLARTLSQRPPLMLLDEPFSGLDIPSRDMLIDVIDQEVRARSLSVVWVTHDIEDLALLANDVRLISEDGSVEEAVFQNPRTLTSDGRASIEATNFGHIILAALRGEQRNSRITRTNHHDV